MAPDIDPPEVLPLTPERFADAAPLRGGRRSQVVLVQSGCWQRHTRLDVGFVALPRELFLDIWRRGFRVLHDEEER